MPPRQQCSTTGRAVFGGRFGHVWGGGQAERVRVPGALEDHGGQLAPERTDRRLVDSLER